MKILVFGATGPTGRLVISRALDLGHEVTAFVRPSSQSLAVSHDRLRLVTGAVTDDAPGVADAVQHQEVVISALGVGKLFKSSNLIARSVKTIVPAMERHGVRHLIFTSALGVGESLRDAPWLARIVFRLLLSDIYADKRVGEGDVRRSGLDWTLVAPAMLTDGPATGKYRAGERLDLRGLPKISRADVAHFILTQVADTNYLRKEVVISN